MSDINSVHYMLKP